MYQIVIISMKIVLCIIKIYSLLKFIIYNSSNFLRIFVNMKLFFLPNYGYKSAVVM